MDPTKFQINEHPSNAAAGSNVMESGYFSSQMSKNQSVPPQISNVPFNSMLGHYSNQIDASVSKNLPNVPQPPVSNQTGGANGYLSSAPSNHPPVVGNIPFQNPSYPFQQFPPNFIPPVSSASPSASSTLNNCRPLFHTPPPSMMPPGNINPMHLGQFNYPPPPISSSVPYFAPGYAKSPSPFPSTHTHQYSNNTVQTVFPNVPNMAPGRSSSYQPSTMSQIISNIQSTSSVTDDKTVVSEKETLLNSFLEKFNLKEKPEVKSSITVAEFRCNLKKCYSLYNLLQSSRENLVSLLNSNQEDWEKELKRVQELQIKLSDSCSILSPNHLAVVQGKLKAIKRKRALKKKLKAARLEEKAKKEQEREQRHREIDKWLDTLKEKNEKVKREIEMKKEADNILAEVRRKIHEAKKTIEKLKVFEKLRSVRQSSAIQKGLNLPPDHSARFDAKTSRLRETLLSQLSEYEQEERALRVMLETEQEDRREEEALWRKRKLMTFQRKKQKALLETLFGQYEEPTPDDPLFLFYQYQNSANKSIENLVQIRHQWDVHLSEKGESIPLQWVVPVPPNSSSWEEHCSN